MRITESNLRRVIRGVLVETYAMKRKQEKDKYMMSLFKDPVKISQALNKAISNLKTKKKSNTEFYVKDDDIIKEVMKNNFSEYFGGSMGVKDSLGSDDSDKIKGALNKILFSIKQGTKLACSIEPKHVKAVTGKFKNYSNIGS